MTHKRKRNHKATPIILTNFGFLKLYNNNLQQLIHRKEKKLNFESFNYHLKLNEIKLQKRTRKLHPGRIPPEPGRILPEYWSLPENYSLEQYP